MRSSSLVLRAAPLLVFACAAQLLQSGAALDAQAQPRERTLFVSAVDEKGMPVGNLGPQDFIVREDGTRREVLRASRATEPIDIALLVDNSTAAEAAIVELREGLRRFVATMAGANQIAIIGLAARPTVLTDYTGNQASLNAGIGRIFAQQESGMTLLEAIIEVSRGLERRESSRAVIVPIITDGVEFTTRYSRDVGDALIRANAALHAITIGLFYETGDTTIRERNRVLNGVSATSGGQRMPLVSPTGIGPSLDTLATELSAQYKIVYVRPETLVPPDGFDVTSARPGVTMRATPMRGQPGV